MGGMILRRATALLAFALPVLGAAAPASAGCGLLGLQTECSTPTTVAPAPAPVVAPAAPLAPAAPAVATPEAAPAPAPAVGQGIAEVPGAADALLALVNQERAAARLPLLQSRPAIAGVAGGHSRTMAARGDIWHNDAYFTAASRASLAAKALGENVAMNSSLEDAHHRLMASPGHRANILNGAFDAVGISVTHDDGGALFITQDFVDSRAAAAAKPAKATKAKATKARRTHAVKARARRR